MHPNPLSIRTARKDDHAFILGLAGRLLEFDLPPWRERGECAAGIRKDIETRLREQPQDSHMYVAEDAEGTRVGFLHLQSVADYFTGTPNAHIADLVTAPGCDGRGIGSALLAFAEHWAKERQCRQLTLAVFPDNARAQALYRRHGFGIDLIRMAKPLK